MCLVDEFLLTSFPWQRESRLNGPRALSRFLVNDDIVPLFFPLGWFEKQRLLRLVPAGLAIFLRIHMGLAPN